MNLDAMHFEEFDDTQTEDLIRASLDVLCDWVSATGIGTITEAAQACRHSYSHYLNAPRRELKNESSPNEAKNLISDLYNLSDVIHAHVYAGHYNCGCDYDCDDWCDCGCGCGCGSGCVAEHEELDAASAALDAAGSAAHRIGANLEHNTPEIYEAFGDIVINTCKPTGHDPLRFTLTVLTGTDDPRMARLIESYLTTGRHATIAEGLEEATASMVSVDHA